VTEPRQPPEAAAEPVAVRAIPKGLPALLYVLGAFGLLIGAMTSAGSVNTALGLSIGRDQYVNAVKGQYVDVIKSQNPLRTMMKPADFERFAQKEAEAQYDRRTATIPLAVAGVVIACLLFSGAIRTMMGDVSALATWSLAAAVAIPHRLLTFVATVVTGHDVENALGGLKQAPWLETPLAIEQTLAGVVAIVLTMYFAACLIYLRRPTLLGRFSAGEAGSRPSA
jgi:hypothetical protein